MNIHPSLFSTKREKHTILAHATMVELLRSKVTAQIETLALPSKSKGLLKILNCK